MFIVGCDCLSDVNVIVPWISKVLDMIMVSYQYRMVSSYWRLEQPPVEMGNTTNMTAQIKKIIITMTMTMIY